MRLKSSFEIECLITTCHHFLRFLVPAVGLAVGRLGWCGDLRLTIRSLWLLNTTHQLTNVICLVPVVHKRNFGLGWGDGDLWSFLHGSNKLWLSLLTCLLNLLLLLGLWHLAGLVHFAATSCAHSSIGSWGAHLCTVHIVNIVVIGSSCLAILLTFNHRFVLFNL